MRIVSIKNKYKNTKLKLGSILLIIILICSGILIIMPSNLNIITAKDASTSTEKTDNNFINGTLDNVLIINTGQENELRLNTYESCTWTKKDPLILPEARDTHAMAPVYGTDKIVLYGGRSKYGSRLGDTWVYDHGNNTWIKKSPANNPGRRDGLTMSPIWGTDKVLIFAGAGPTAVNDTWIYDLSDNNWTRKFPANKPRTNYFHRMASIYGTDKVLLFGSYIFLGEIYINETWIYDLSDNNWTNVTKYPSPDIRAGHAMATIDNTDKVLLFGGYLGRQSSPQIQLNDTWIYDFSDGNWTKRSIVNAPKARSAHTMAPIHGTDNVVLFSGPFNNDTWIYDLSDNNWIEKEPLRSPRWKAWHKMTAVFGTNKIVLFGGGTPNSNETWEFNLFNYLNNGTYISSSHEIGPNALFKSIIWDGSVSANTGIKFQLRTADSELNLHSKLFVGPNGTPTYYYTSSPSDIWLGHNNGSWVQYKAYLFSNNDYETPILRNVSITYNYWPNTTLVAPNNESIEVNNKPNFEWNFTDPDSRYQSSFQLLIDDDESFNSIDFDSDEQSSTNTTWQFPNRTGYSEIPDGRWYWKVRTQDNDGDWGLYSNSWKMIIDSKTPSSIIIDPIDNRYYNRLNAISGIATEPLNGTGINKVEISITRLKDKKHWDGYDWSLEESWLLVTGTTNWYYDTSSVLWTSGSNYNVRSRAIDNATNVEIPGTGKVFTIDMENVVFTNGWPLDNDVSPTQDVEFGITISDTISGVNASTIQYALSYDRGKTWNSWKSVDGLNNKMEINITLNLTFPNGTGNWIQWRVSDIAGNGPKQSMVYLVKVNTWQPTLRVKLLSPENGSIFQKKNSVELYWMLKNNNILNISYDIYLDTVNPPTINRSGLVNTSLIINDLIERETYYWTIIPKLGKNTGSCISGVWSFTVDIPSPSVKLISPANGSTISSRTPTLIWSLEYGGSEKVKYEVYFDSNLEPELLYKDYSNTYFSPQSILEYNTTYYWQIVPNASGIKGPPSEIWSFTVEEKDYLPSFELKLELEPAVIELTPDETKYVKAIVTNLGDINDTILLRIWIPAEIRVSAMVNEPNMIEASPRGIAEFKITVMAFEDAEQNEISLRVVAISETAAEYNLTAVKETTLIVKIKIIDMDTEKHEKDNSSSLEGSWYFVFIVIIIILILIILAIIIIRKRRNDIELPSAEVVTAKSEEILVPEIVTEQVPTTIATIPTDTVMAPADDTPQLAASATTTPVPVPKLVKSMETVQATPTPQAPQVPEQVTQAQVPQLPPAQGESVKEKTDETLETKTGDPLSSTPERIDKSEPSDKI